MGGLARRVSYIKAFREKFTRIPTLLVDTGYFLSDEQSTHGDLRFDAVIKNEVVLKAYDQFPVDVLNVSSQDLQFVTRYLKKGAPGVPAILKRAVSANIVDESTDAAALEPFAIREVVDGRPGAPSKPIRVAFIGLSDIAPVASSGFKIVDPIDAARRTVSRARQRADLVIALAHIRTEQAIRLAREVPGIDIVLAGNGEMFTPPLTFGQTTVVFTPLEMRMLGELRIYRDAEGKFSFKERFITLDGEVPDDAEALAAAAAANILDTAPRREALKLLSALAGGHRQPGTAADKQGAVAPGAGYVSSAACAQCHAAQYSRWANSAHARATDPLVFKQQEFEAACFSCHATGVQRFDLKSGTGEAKLHSVQCEQCHGPASDHVANPGKGYGRIASRSASCANCHTPQTSPKFDFASYWEKIKH